jgi:ribose-phosphate pyrophosphokinase
MDDICSRGGTFKFSALKLRELGASEVRLFVSHCENVIDKESLIEAGITKVYTTDSIYRPELHTADYESFIKIL